MSRDLATIAEEALKLPTMANRLHLSLI